MTLPYSQEANLIPAYTKFRSWDRCSERRTKLESAGKKVDDKKLATASV